MPAQNTLSYVFNLYFHSDIVSYYNLLKRDTFIKTSDTQYVFKNTYKDIKTTKVNK